jgi:hypothetical protein
MVRFLLAGLVRLHVLALDRHAPNGIEILLDWQQFALLQPEVSMGSFGMIQLITCIG